MSALRGKADITLMSAMGQKRTLAQRLKTPKEGLPRPFAFIAAAMYKKLGAGYG